ncbi:hypothetical protein AGMMS50239_25350 [Bacteroidia bacterium]|nr:hypothetical protein AGMMS50239_25230 [Bacteroidia bacterium]GHT65483.1 hypothetical protein AGMMS50239_25350 [Bacteroidia bacterium]
MEDLSFIIALILLSITTISYLSIWKLKSFFHPGFYFSILWLVAVFSEWYLIKYNLAIVVDVFYIDELNFLVSFTALCFLGFQFIGLKYKQKQPILNCFYVKDYFKNIVILIGIVAIFSFIYSGASLNMGLNRIAYGGYDEMRHIHKESSLLEILFNVLKSPLPFVAIFSGYLIGKQFVEKEISFKNKFILYIPFIVYLLETIQIGGRNPAIIGLKNYLLGFGLAMPYLLNSKKKVKLLSYVLIIFVSFSLFSTIVGNQRAMVRKQSISSEREDSAFYSLFSGVMDYMSAHYWGYQLRRTDYINNDYTYGSHTFYGFLNISIPFSSSLETDNLWSVLGVDYEPLEIYKSGVTGFYTTYSIYLQLYKDFGPAGIYIFLLLFTFFTHHLFVRMQKKHNISFFDLFWFYMCFSFWSSSNFDSFYSSTFIKSLIVMSIIVVFVQKQFRTQLKLAKE